MFWFDLTVNISSIHCFQFNNFNCIYLKDQKTNATLLISILRTITMVRGEQNSLNTFILPLSRTESPQYHYAQTTIFFLVLFIILVPILLTKLLVSPIKIFMNFCYISCGIKQSVRRNTIFIEHAFTLEKKIEWRCYTQHSCSTPNFYTGSKYRNRA